MWDHSGDVALPVGGLPREQMYWNENTQVTK